MRSPVTAGNVGTKPTEWGRYFPIGRTRTAESVALRLLFDQVTAHGIGRSQKYGKPASEFAFP